MGRAIQIKDPGTKEELYPITRPEYVKNEEGAIIDIIPVGKGAVKNSTVVKYGNNITTNSNEFACGRYNQSVESSDTQLNGTLFSVGVGTSSEDRKNAIEVKKNGDVYLWIGEDSYKVEEITTDEINGLFKE